MTITTPAPTTVERLDRARTRLYETRRALIDSDLAGRKAAHAEHMLARAYLKAELADAHRRAGQ